MVARAKWGAGESGKDKFVIDPVMRQIPDHCHIHARKIWKYE